MIHAEGWRLDRIAIIVEKQYTRATSGKAPHK